jgi:tRNA-Thr(GGU) m(6)t(6)A37 methyltransferase TsaA
MNIEPIAKIVTDFDSKFGIPRQSGIVKNLSGTVIFEKKYRNPDAIRGIEGFSHLWLIWGFSENVDKEYSPTVRPPKLGGNERMGVFATRSPFRPNHLGLSSVKLEKVELTEKHGYVLRVSGADMVNGTPIYDIKPYLAFTDSIPDAIGGFADEVKDYTLEIVLDKELLRDFPSEKIDTLTGILAEDPRPSYIEDENRVYGFPFAGFEIKFKVKGKVLTVISVEKRNL